VNDVERPNQKRLFSFRWALPYVLSTAVLLWQWQPWVGRPTHEHVLHLAVSILFLVILFFVIRAQARGRFGEDENSMPAWRRRIRIAVAPYRRVTALAMLAVMALAWCNAAFDWRLLNLDSRQFNGVALLVGLMWLVFAAPTTHALNPLNGTRGTNSEQ
jgi:hypothetical protein